MRAVDKKGGWVLVAIMLCVASAHAVTILNKTTGQTLLYEDFESPSGVCTNSSDTADYYPDNPPIAVGTWQPYEYSIGNKIQVCSYDGDGSSAPAATLQGTNCLRIYRESGAQYMEFIPSSPQTTSNDVIHLETMVWLPNSAPTYAVQIAFYGPSESDYVANVISGDSGSVLGYDGSAWQATSLSWKKKTWQKWEIDYAVSNETFDLTIDGIKETLPCSSSPSAVHMVRLRAGSNGATVFLDSTGYDGSRQNDLILFRDGFENSSVDSPPAVESADIGSYLYALLSIVSSKLNIRTNDKSVVGGPTQAYSGSGYLELYRNPYDDSTVSFANCMFAGGSVVPATLGIRASFLLWRSTDDYNPVATTGKYIDSIPGHGISKGTTKSLLTDGVFLTYNIIRYDDSYDGYKIGPGYQNVAPTNTFPKGSWVPVEIVWNPEKEESTVSINGAESLVNVLVGSVPDVLDRFVFAPGNGPNLYWIDDVEVEWVYIKPPPAGTVILLN
ncbi:MAG: hypothetical protein PF904_04535 [Kiritimatiellae bacterium]|jgi:hypothetical protein|nr:hypothetical protein [Kiritimatiellia bacterium]